MIVPDKYTTIEGSLIGLGAQLAQLLETPASVSTLWTRFKRLEPGETFERYVAALDVLYAGGLIDLETNSMRVYRVR